jgi:hypothetical protein
VTGEIYGGQNTTHSILGTYKFLGDDFIRFDATGLENIDLPRQEVGPLGCRVSVADNSLYLNCRWMFGQTSDAFWFRALPRCAEPCSLQSTPITSREPGAALTPTPLPDLAPVHGVIRMDTTYVFDKPDLASGTIIANLHVTDEVLIYGAFMNPDGTWWYLVRLYKRKNPQTAAPPLEAGGDGWIYYASVDGAEGVNIEPTVAAIETMRAAVAPPTLPESSLALPTPVPSILP